MKAFRQAGFADRIEARAARQGRRDCGFTMVELVVTILIVGILAAAIGPRFFQIEVFRARGFYDEMLSALHYAQKTAVAQRRSVYVKLDGAGETATACYTSTFPCSGADRVSGPYGELPYRVAAAAGVDLQTDTTLFFDALGRPYNAADTVPDSTFTTLTVTIVGGDDTRTITVERETGYAR